MVRGDAATRERGMHDVPSPGPQRDVRDSTAFSKEEQIPGFVAVSVRGDRDLLSFDELLIAVAGQPNTARRVHRLRESRTTDPTRRLAALERRERRAGPRWAAARGRPAGGAEGGRQGGGEGGGVFRAGPARQQAPLAPRPLSAGTPPQPMARAGARCPPRHALRE